ncbi:MAG: hypothetical protein MUF71_06470 [Candidatus Kapabacteria bacterium]|nr:hypothetical protein [Candidatus Kapabacteria bacterium]
MKKVVFIAVRQDRHNEEHSFRHSVLVRKNVWYAAWQKYSKIAGYKSPKESLTEILYPNDLHRIFLSVCSEFVRIFAAQ